MFDNYLIMVGKNEKGNIKLLKISNSNDIWMHIKNYPGAHVIIKNSKLKIDEKILNEGAKLAVAFSNKDEGIVKEKFFRSNLCCNCSYRFASILFTFLVVFGFYVARFG